MSDRFRDTASAGSTRPEMPAGGPGEGLERLRFEARLLDAVEQAVMATDLDGVITYWNAFAEKLYGWSAEEAIGRNVIDLIVVSSQPREVLLANLRTGESWSAEITVRHKCGTTFPVQVTRSGVRDDEGRLIAIVGVSRDISDRRRMEAALRRSEERLRVAQHAGGIGTFEWTLATGEVTVSDEFCRLWGLPPQGSIRAELFAELVHPDDRALLGMAGERPLEDAMRYTEYRVIRPDTRAVRWLARRGELMYDDVGRSARVVGVTYDITDRKRAEKQQQLVARELAHRVKNTLTMVQSLATQSLRRADSLQEAGEIFTARLAALASAHDALVEQHWEEASLAAVVAGAVQVHNEGGQIAWTGDDLALGPRATLAVSLALHELCTNAVKYGALSRPEGRVTIAWAVTNGGEPRLDFRWQESGGPPVAPPLRKGFGSRLIEKGLASLNGRVEIAYEPTGLRLRLDAPVASLKDATQPPQS